MGLRGWRGVGMGVRGGGKGERDADAGEMKGMGKRGGK